MTFHGTSKECFADFAERYPVRGLARTTAQNQRTIAEFLNVGGQTVARWARLGFSAEGESLIRARCLLELFGYEVVDFRSLPEPVRELARLIAYQCMTMDEAVGIFEFAGKNQRHQAMSTLVGHSGLLPSRLAKLQTFVDEYQEVIQKTHDERLASLRKRLTPAAPKVTADALKASGVQSPRHIDLPVAAPVASVSRGAHAVLIESAANQVRALLPLTELLLSDEFTAAERAHFRDLAGSDGPFKLSNRLNGLCGERAREQQAAKQPATRNRG